VASLSFRLFGNIFAGEVLLVSMSALLAWVVPIPFLFLEIIVGLIQAFIFMTLILTYLTIHTTAEEH
jgi:F-type H+-transporting ATPase subunit a